VRAKKERDERVSQVIIGAGILAAVLIVSTAIRLLGLMPGFLGEVFAMFAGFLSTPVFLEISFFILGILIVLAINLWRHKREGDEFVYLDEVKDPEAKDLPEHAKFAVFAQTPLPPETPSLLTQAEGALAIGDFEAAGEALAAMDEAELAKPETRELRIALAKATGKEELARRLETGG
jgi:hypothetical protein